MSVEASTRTKTRWGVKHKLYDGALVSGWTTTPASDLGDFEIALIVILNQGATNAMRYELQACCDINDPDWYAWSPQPTLGAASGVFESLQWPWGAVRLRLQANSGVGTDSTVWVNTRLRT